MKNLIITLTLLLGAMSYGQVEVGEIIETTFVYDYGDRYTTRSTPQLDCRGQDGQYRLNIRERDNGDLRVQVKGFEGVNAFENFYEVVGSTRQELIDRVNLNKDTFESAELGSTTRSANADYWDYDHNLVDPPCSDRGFRANQNPGRYLQYKEGYTGRSGSRFNYGPRGDAYINVGSNFTIRFGTAEWTETYAHRAYNRLRQAYAHEIWEQDLIARGFTEYTTIALYQWVIPHGSQTIRVGRYRTDRIQIRIGNDTWVREVPAGIEFIDCVLAGGDPRVCDD